MTCFFCTRPARGVCRFCGRALCENHTRFAPFVLDIYRSHTRDRAEALVTEDALSCGTCKPRPQPVVMPELD